jgi:hypothetical protein
MPFDYDTYVATMANLTAYDPTDPDFIQILPSFIAYAENRIYREADFLSTIIRDDSANLTANSRNFTLPSSVGQFDVVRQVNVITPAGSTTADGQRNPLTGVSTEVIDALWPSESAPEATTIPDMFSMLTDDQIIVGPPPGDAFNVEVIGTVIPTPLSASNTTTYLTLYLWDLFIAASMVFAAGFMKNYGAQADDPRQAMSWETQYQTLFKSADLVDSRQRFAAASWTSAQPENYATNQRG